MGARTRGLVALVVVLGALATACPSDSNESLVESESPSETVSGGEPSASPSGAPNESSESPAIGADISGKWAGTWANTTPDDSTGTFIIEWTQSGDSLDGTISIQGTPCLDGGTIIGEIHGNGIEFGAVKGQVLVEYTGKIEGASMSGTYETDCGNGEGTWKAAKIG